MEKRKPIMMPIAWALEIITEEDYHELQALSLPNDNVEVVDTQLILEVDTTYHRNGKRELLTFELDQLEEAKKQYHLHHKGFVALYKAEFDENYSVIKSTLIQDEEGKRYVKGSPFYKFPTVKRLAKQEWINLKEQEIALQKERKSNGKRRSK
jgi:hypothetical protein